MFFVGVGLIIQTLWGIVCNRRFQKRIWLACAADTKGMVDEYHRLSSLGEPAAAAAAAAEAAASEALFERPVVPYRAHTAMLVALLALPAAGFLLGFSAMGYGIPVYVALVAREGLGLLCLSLAAGLGLALYLLDAEGWTGDFDRSFWCDHTAPRARPLFFLPLLDLGREWHRPRPGWRFTT